MLDKEIKKRLSIDLPIQKHTEVKLAATALGMSIKEFIDIAIKDMIDREKK